MSGFLENYKQNFLMMIILTIVVVFNTGCGAGPGRDTGEFERYVTHFENSFEHYHGIRIQASHITIKLGTLEKAQLALCVTSTLTVPSITVNTLYWNGLSD